MLSNIRRERFAHGIVQGKPAARAYIDAGYKARGHSAESAAARLLRNVEVEARIKELAEELRKPAIADADELQRFLTTVIRGVDENGAEVDEDHVTKDGFIVKVRPSFRDRIKASELLMRAQGVFSQSDTRADGELAAIAEALARADHGADRAVN